VPQATLMISATHGKLIEHSDTTSSGVNLVNQAAFFLLYTGMPDPVSHGQTAFFRFSRKTEKAVWPCETMPDPSEYKRKSGQVQETTPKGGGPPRIYCNTGVTREAT